VIALVGIGLSMGRLAAVPIGEAVSVITGALVAGDPGCEIVKGSVQAINKLPASNKEIIAIFCFIAFNPRFILQLHIDSTL
jgi:hypothetical protein